MIAAGEGVPPMGPPWPAPGEKGPLHRTGQGSSSFSPSEVRTSPLPILAALRGKLELVFPSPPSLRQRWSLQRHMEPVSEEWAPAVSHGGMPARSFRHRRARGHPPSVREARNPASFTNRHRDKGEEEERRRFDCSYRSVNFLNLEVGKMWLLFW